MDEKAIREINNSPFKAYFVIAGGGQSFIGRFCEVPGASKTLLGAEIPYDKTVLEKLIGKVESFACAETAQKMAVYAFNACLVAGTPRRYALGYGVTCALVTDNERVGRKHKIYISVHTDIETQVLEMILEQGRDRITEEGMVCDAIFRSLLRNTVGDLLRAPDIIHPEKYREYSVVGSKDIRDLVEGKLRILSNDLLEFKKKIVIYSGSFNPLHEGHLKIKELAEEILKQKVVLDLSVVNAEKGELDYISILNRVNQIKTYPHVLTNAPTFLDKAKVLRDFYECNGLSPKIVFVVGADAWNRIWDEKYCSDMDQLGYQFSDLNVKFLVFGRNGMPILKNFNWPLQINSAKARNFFNPFSSTLIREKNKI